RHQRAFAGLDAQRPRQAGRQRLDRHTEPRARHVSALLELGYQLLGEVDRDRESDADAAAAAAEYGRVDADDPAVLIEERATGVARVDRGVGLNEVVVRPTDG